jgi:PKD repeat protein
LEVILNFLGMKRHLLLLLSLFLFYAVQAASVSVQTAQTVAVNFFKVSGFSGQTNLTATLTYTRNENDNSVDFYVFNMAPVKGFVIVSGNNNIVPVIGYSTETNFSFYTPYPTGINYWMNHVAARIHKTVVQNIQADARIAGLWTAYLNGVNPIVPRSDGVNPLLTTAWDQEPFYNALCPYNAADQQQAVTGCVATAMAQIMKFWSYPVHGKGSYSYVDSMPAFSNNYGVQTANFDTTFYWSQMPASINSPNNAIARLMYDCGVSVAMDYGDDNQGGSGAWVLQSEAGGPNAPCAQYAYVNYFYYNPNTIQGIVKSNYNQTDFINLIENELNNSRVVQYEGDDTSGAGGHTWVCDGYDANNNLHMNWGWSGQNDGFFAIGNLDAGHYNFDDNEAALIGIEPLSPVNVTVVAANPSLCPGTSTTLTAHGPASATYSWIPTNGLSCPTCSTTMVNCASNAIYSVTADSAGVKGNASVAINIVQAVMAGFSTNTTTDCAVPANIPFTNLSTNASNYLWDFGDGATDTTANPVHTYAAYGAYNVKLSSFNHCGVDSVLRNQAVQITDKAPVVAGQSICTGNSTTLTASGPGSIQWYDAPAGGNLVNTGTSLTTPVLNGNVTYYVYAVLAPPGNTVGPADSTLGGGSYFTNTNQHGLFFSCSVPQVLETVDIYAQNAGDRTIILIDTNGNTINSATLNIPSGPSTITLNFPLPAEYGLKLAISGNNYLFRNNSGANYPYPSSDGTVVITNSDAGTPGYYYFFYNWKLQQPGCTTTTTVVPVTVIGGNNNSINQSQNGKNVSFWASPGITSCSWSFGDGSTATQLHDSHTYAEYGSYTVVMIESNGQCSDTLTEVITLYPEGINEAGAVDMLSLFPDPAQNQLNIRITSQDGGDDWALVVYDIIGQKILTRNIQLQPGQNTFALDISSLAPGVHILSLQHNKTLVTRRFVKAD